LGERTSSSLAESLPRAIRKNENVNVDIANGNCFIRHTCNSSEDHRQAPIACELEEVWASN
jgi:hypothetical protein